jgi:signal transduction histidine kinase
MTKLTLLCIDDEPIVLDSLRRELSEWLEEMYELEIANGGKEALELVEELIAEECEIAVIISDYIMPDLKGDEVLKQVHQISPNTLQIMLTGQANVEGITNAINSAKLYRYIAKPWQPEDLRFTVKEALNSYLHEKQLSAYQRELELKVEERTRELSRALQELKATQEELVQSEKMAALGQLVAGVAHEVNTPIGNALLAATTLSNETQSFLGAIHNTGNLKRSVLNHYMNTAKQTSEIIVGSLERAGALIQNFKQVAVDQTIWDKRCFNVKNYLESILITLDPQLKSANHQITIVGEDDLLIDSYPGALAQVVTNLVQNSIVHAYQSGQQGQLEFTLEQDEEYLLLSYADDGCGIPEENLSKIFEPFFTTARNRGGTGLGLHIVYNLVTQTLQGNITCQSTVGAGTIFVLELPVTTCEKV